MKKKRMMVLGITFCLGVFFTGCIGGGEGGKDEVDISAEADSDFDLTESFAKLNTKITITPPACADTTTASFKFKCTGGTLPCKFQYRLDGADKWTKAKKALNLSALSEGPHTILVRAIDATGNKDKTPQSYTWKIGIDNDGDTYADNCAPVGAQLDCDDTAPAINPGAAEITCNGVDENCNGQADDVLGDGDGDGEDACTDCNDADPAINSSAVEITCNGVDENCAPSDDLADLDNDSYICDCDESNPLINPGALEVACNGVDENCNGLGDDGLGDVDDDGEDACTDCDDTDVNNWISCTTCLDGDNDLYYAGCDAYITIAGEDCNDGEVSVNPGATEVPCDGIDNDCNSWTSDSLGDADNDEEDACTDCDDTDPVINSSALEITCNSVDENCNGMMDDDTVDGDGDGISVVVVIATIPMRQSSLVR